MSAYPSSAWAKYFARANLALAWLGGVCLIALVLVLAVGVIMRYVLGQPILGINEIVQLTALALVMASLPYATEHQVHVRVDVFDNMLGRWGPLFGDVLSRLISGYVLSLLTLRAWDKAMDALEWGDATNMLNLPIWPFYAVLAAGTALCVGVFAADILLLLTGKAESKND
ncbi:TRAP transporter small permease [Donghicola tyrosinivorans]|uniref:TRAP transporter small permease protein n=1 Tax=Donghicola tyrosinivorans TaxID=1652492 RepID=A0A2T0WRT7_9RHOB|nr:TRAP transporter small permease [Donghicola tyrosinivorans]PRY89385.1 TRAP-type C4-dicarboxylate transport system permease small subunit [Donghicola tyrosinivorans]